MSTIIEKLPQEVTDSIIDCLVDVRDDLKACALVHRSWLDRARYHLHREVTLDCGQKKVHSANYYTTGAAEYIRSLKLIAPPQPPVQGTHDAKARTIWKIIPRFTELHTLTIVFSNWTGSAKTYEWLRPVTRHVTHLNLIFASFTRVTDFFEFVAMFPELESLSLTNLSFGTSVLTAIPVPPPSTLVNLHMRGHIVPPEVTLAFALWLCRLPRPAVPKFSVKWEVGQPECLIPIVDGLGPRLAHLELPLWTARGIPSEVIKGALQSLTLTSLGSEIGKEDVNELLEFLFRVPASELRSITYDVRTTTQLDTIDGQALATLDDALFNSPHSRFPALEKVHFRLPQNPSSPSDLQDRFQKALPRAHKKGLLLVEAVSERQ